MWSRWAGANAGAKARPRRRLADGRLRPGSMARANPVPPERLQAALQRTDQRGRQGLAIMWRTVQAEVGRTEALGLDLAADLARAVDLATARGAAARKRPALVADRPSLARHSVPGVAARLSPRQAWSSLPPRRDRHRRSYTAAAPRRRGARWGLPVVLGAMGVVAGSALGAFSPLGPAVRLVAHAIWARM